MGVLETEGLVKEFGGFVAIDDVDFSVTETESRSIIGPNGAGKTTFFNLLSGTMPPTDGSIFLRGTDVTGLQAHEIATRGVTRSFQITNLFEELSVRETLQLGAQRTEWDELPILRYLGAKSTGPGVQETVESLLSHISLEPVSEKLVTELSYGQRRRLEIGLAFSTGSDIILLDEPTAGLTREETTELISIITDLGEGKTILLIEHDIEFVLEFSDRISVLHQGRLIADGTPEEIQNDDRVQDVYLGTDDESGGR